MALKYNRIAGSSVERLAALSDGVIAVDITLLVLELHAPEVEHVGSEHDLWIALTHLAPKLIMILMSFVTLGIFWNGQQAQLNYLRASNRDLTWIHIAFLASVSLVPFSTQLLASYYDYRLAVGVEWLNIFLMGLLLYCSWKYADKSGLIREDVSVSIRAAICKRIVIAQALYAVSALVCLYSSRLSIFLIFILQLWYAIAPRLPGQQHVEALPAD